MDGEEYLPYDIFIEVAQDINSEVNKMPYMAEEGDYWTSYPEDHGDCDDYAAWKRRIFREKFPQYKRAFMFATAWDETGGYHAVLLVRTTRGDFILDNRFHDFYSYDGAKKYKWHSLETELGFKNILQIP